MREVVKDVKSHSACSWHAVLLRSAYRAKGKCCQAAAAFSASGGGSPQMLIAVHVRKLCVRGVCAQVHDEEAPMGGRKGRKAMQEAWKQ